MAIVGVYELPTGTLDQYDRVMAAFENTLAPGNLLHACGSFGGGFRAVDVFESRAVAEEVAAMVGETAQSFGLARTVSEFETHNLLRA